MILELVPKLIDYALKRMVLEQALGKIGLKPAFSTRNCLALPRRSKLEREARFCAAKCAQNQKSAVKTISNPGFSRNRNCCVNPLVGGAHVHPWQMDSMVNGKTLNVAIELKASPPPTAQTSLRANLRLNCVELGSFAKQNSISGF
ncbi:MAG: hypothetical protein LBK66_14820 [Spirochaetaceae bacterium]|nr:hypothetical protein [Spirochaetaceae bacterium]